MELRKTFFPLPFSCDEKRPFLDAFYLRAMLFEFETRPSNERHGMDTKEFHGVIPPVVIPLNEKKQLDLESFERSINRMIAPPP